MDDINTINGETDRFLPVEPKSWSRPTPYLAIVQHRDEISRAPEDGALQTLDLGPFDFELGGHLPQVTIAFRTWGRLNETADNAVLVLHALTGDSRATGDGGWWEPLIGPGRVIDTNESFVVCANVIGGCQGSTGPATIDPSRGRPYATRFPLVTVGDMVNAQRRLVEHLGIRQLVAIGGSIGGFQALEWATRQPELVSATVVLAASGRLGAQAIAAHSELGRRAIMADPNWHGGDYAEYGVFPAAGLALARMAAMVTYQSRESMEARFGRRTASRPTYYPSFGSTFDIESYLHHQGESLVKRFDANSYLYLTRAMDLYDVGRDGGDEFWLRRISAPILLVGIRSDWLFPPDDIRRLASQLTRLGKEVMYEEIDSPYGHDAFLKEWEQLAAVLTPLMQPATTSRAFAW